jgi:hypothetical protein
MIGTLIARLILVPLGLLFAAAAVLFVLVTLGQERLILSLSAASSEAAIFDTLGMVLKLLLALISLQMWILPLLVAIAGEVGRVRAAAFYVVAGGLILALIPLLARIAPGGTGAVVTGAGVYAIFATAGFAGGLTYWLIAGRRAGLS